MQFINLTPHTINVTIGKHDEIVALPADGRMARVSSKSVPAGVIDGIFTVKTVYGEVETIRKNDDGTESVLHVGLPEPQADTVYIVSAIVGGRVQGRDDVYGPDSGPTAIRENGQIKAVRNLVKFV